jgi:hypothetical protein
VIELINEECLSSRAILKADPSTTIDEISAGCNVPSQSRIRT